MDYSATDNPIDYYEVWLNGSFYENTTDDTEGWVVTGFTASTEYTIKLKTVDTLGNKSGFSNEVTKTTLYTETQTYADAMGIYADGTVYYSGTAQECTGFQIIEAVDEFVGYLINESLFGLWPIYRKHRGNSGKAFNKSLRSRILWPYLVRGWVHNRFGAFGNGVNTYAKTGYLASGTVTVNSNGVTAAIGYYEIPAPPMLHSFWGVLNSTTAVQIGEYRNNIFMG